MIVEVLPVRIMLFLLHNACLISLGMKEESQPCPHCGKIFSTKSSLEPHIMMVHKGVRKKCPDCGKVLSDLWKHMRTIHGHYRRRVKIPKDEAILKMTSEASVGEIEEDNDARSNILSPTLSSSSQPKFTTPPPLQRLSNLTPPVMHHSKTSETLKTKPAQSKTGANKRLALDDDDANQTKSNKASSASLALMKHKRKNSLPLKVKMPFKISKKSAEGGSNVRKQALRLSDDDVDL